MQENKIAPTDAVADSKIPDLESLEDEPFPTDGGGVLGTQTAIIDRINNHYINQEDTDAGGPPTVD